MEIGIRNCLLAIGMLLASASHAVDLGAQAAPAQSDPEAVDLKSLQELGCPRGLEGILPGIYYYCVGARDLARNDNARGVDMLKIAAAWGSKPAQFTLGVGYFNGDIVAMDRPQGLAWLGLAAERKDPNYLAVFQSAWQKASPEEKARASALWRSMLPKYGDAHAAKRSERHYQYARMQIMRDETLGARWCAAGLTARDLAPPQPGSQDADSAGGCQMTVSSTTLARQMDKYANSLFDGLSGHVSVGPLLEVTPPGAYQKEPTTGGKSKP